MVGMREGITNTKNIKILAYNAYEAINAKDIGMMRKIFHPGVIGHAMGEIGIDSMIEMVKRTFEKFPNTHFAVEDVITENDKAALRVTIHGRNTSLDKSFPLILEIFRFENNQIVEVWGAGISSEKFPK